MRAMLLLGLLLVTEIITNAQECEYIQNKTSGMDGTRLVITKPVLFSSQRQTGDMETWSTIYGDTVVVLAYVIYSQDDITVTKGDSLTISLEDNSTVSLTIHQDAAGIGTETRKLTVLTMLARENLQKLEQYPATRISVGTSKGKLIYSAKKKKQRNSLIYLISCVKEYLNEGR